jgi:poly(A) polymerase
MLDGMRNPTSSLALGVLLHDVGKPPTFTIAERIRFDHHVETGVEMSRHILARLRCPNDLIRRVEALVANHLRFKDVPRMRESTLRRFLRLEDFQEHLELHRLDCLSSHRNLDNYYFAKEKLETLTPAELKPPPLITGHDLIRCGYKPGPAFAAMLDAVESAQLESRVRTSEEAMALVRSLFVPPSGDPKPAGT